MVKYKLNAAYEIASELKFSDEQLDFLGRLLSLEKDDLVRFVEINNFADCFDNDGPLINLRKNNRSFRTRVVLHDRFYDLSFENSNNEVRRLLDSVEINHEGLFSYSIYSYGLEKYNVNVLIGGMPIRQDIKVHRRDKLFLS